MLTKRLIPILLLKGNKLVKGENFKNFKYIGDPINVVKIFNKKKIDELIILDTEASKLNKINFELISEIASECFMPVTYGGGIKSILDADKIFALGIEKICLNYSIIKNKILITQISEKYGKQSIISLINIKKNIFGKKKIFNYLDNKILDLNLNSEIKSCVDAGSGEILIQSVDKEGQLEGIDNDLIKTINPVSCPTIYSGGITNKEDIFEVYKKFEAAAGGAYFVFRDKNKGVLIKYPNISR